MTDCHNERWYQLATFTFNQFISFAFQLQRCPKEKKLVRRMPLFFSMLEVATLPWPGTEQVTTTCACWAGRTTIVKSRCCANEWCPASLRRRFLGAFETETCRWFFSFFEFLFCNNNQQNRVSGFWMLIEVVQAPEAQGWFTALGDFFSSASAARCLPAMRRCFASAEDVHAETPRWRSVEKTTRRRFFGPKKRCDFPGFWRLSDLVYNFEGGSKSEIWNFGSSR